MAKPREDRAFGGKAGIWLKKRKVHPVANDNVQHKKKVTPPSTNSNHLLTVNQNKAETDKLCLQNPTKRVVVGWDDVRCRPIYREAESSTSATTSSSSSLNDESDDEVEARDDGNNSEDENSVEGKRASATASVLVTSTSSSSNEQQSRKTRAYGSRKRTSNLSSHHDIVNTQQRKRPYVGKKKETVVSAAASVMTPSIHRMTFDLATPQTGLGGDNICDALNSETKATPREPEDSNDSFVVTKKEKKIVLRKEKKQPAGLAPELDFVDETVSQPSSTTSLAAAKAFFERLDAQQTLTLDASETPVAQGKRCVRTRRAIQTEGNDILHKEYEEYATAAQATGVDPLSLEQYAVNRSAFFRTGDMYDGFLDG